MSQSSMSYSAKPKYIAEGNETLLAFFSMILLLSQKKNISLLRKEKKRIKTMATAIRAIPTLYGETAKNFESEATLTEQNPGTEDYRHEAKIVADFLKTCPDL